MQLIQCHCQTSLGGDGKALSVFGTVYLSDNIKYARETKIRKIEINILYHLICYVIKLKVFVYVQDIRQIPIIVSKPMITTTSWIMYVWWPSLESSATKIQRDFISYLHVIMKVTIYHGCAYWCRILNRYWATNPEDRDTWSRSSTDRARRNGNRNRNHWSRV